MRSLKKRVDGKRTNGKVAGLLNIKRALSSVGRAIGS